MHGCKPKLGSQALKTAEQYGLIMDMMSRSIPLACMPYAQSQQLPQCCTACILLGLACSQLS